MSVCLYVCFQDIRLNIVYNDIKWKNAEILQILKKHLMKLFEETIS